MQLCSNIFELKYILTKDMGFSNNNYLPVFQGKRCSQQLLPRLNTLSCTGRERVLHMRDRLGAAPNPADPNPAALPWAETPSGAAVAHHRGSLSPGRKTRSVYQGAALKLLPVLKLNARFTSILIRKYFSF